MTRGKHAFSVIMFGPELSARGGIAAVASILVDEPSLARFNIRYVPTWVEGQPGQRLVAFGRAVAAAGRVPAGTVVHVHMASRGSFLRKGIILLLAQWRGARTVVHLHGAEFHSFAEGARLIVRRAIALVFRATDIILVLSPVWVERTARFSGRRDAIVVPNPVCVPAQAADMRGAPSVVFSGRLGDRKGTPELLKAIAALQARGLTEVRWVLAGDGDIERFRRLALDLPHPEQVRFTGWLSHPDMQRELSAAWVFCLPSHDEGKPMALLEAMASGLACVATPVGGVPDVVRSGETGILVSVGDVEALSAALEGLLACREGCLRMGARARASMSEGYSSAIVGEVLSRVYEDLIERGPAAGRLRRAWSPGGRRV